jgi:HlyD family secretion protein
MGGSAVVLFLVVGLGLWAATCEIAGAVIASGTVVVATSVKRVQHPTGGVVGDVLVKNGDRVVAGDLLLRLDETVTRANLDVLLRQLEALGLREARLKAERDGLASIILPAGEKTAGRQEMIDGEVGLFESRRAVVDGQRAELRKRIAELREEASGLAGQMLAKQQEIDLVQEEIRARRKLDDKEREARQLEIRQVEVSELATEGRVLALRREQARLEGELGQLRATAAQVRGRIAESEFLIARLGNEARRSILAELAEVQAKAAELSERRIAAEDQLHRVELRAPETGAVHELAVAGRGDVIGAGQVLMLIVPGADKLVIEAKIEPHDIDQVIAADQALVRLVAFDQHVTPELRAVLTRVSADLARDSRTGSTYFVARVEIADEELKRLGAKRLVPGMPAEVQIETQRRTALSYLLKPLSDQLARAWKER